MTTELGNPSSSWGPANAATTCCQNSSRSTTILPPSSSEDNMMIWRATSTGKIEQPLPGGDQPPSKPQRPTKHQDRVSILRQRMAKIRLSRYQSRMFKATTSPALGDKGNNDCPTAVVMLCDLSTTTSGASSGQDVTDHATTTTSSSIDTESWCTAGDRFQSTTHDGDSQDDEMLHQSVSVVLY